VSEERGPWYLLTGLAIGLLLGLLYTWLISPVKYVDTSPASLRAEFKDHYRSLISLSYGVNNDLGRSISRLGLLQDENSAYELGAQAQRIMAEDGSQTDARAMAQLAADLAKFTPAAPPTLAAGTPSPIAQATATLDESQMIATSTPQPAATFTPMATFTPRAQSMLQPDLSSPLELRERQSVCTPGLVPGLLQVEVQDDDGGPIRGVRIDVAWDGGTTSFYTGLYPEISPGYADFVMQPGVVYSLRAGDGGEVVSDLQSEQCTDAAGNTYPGGVRLVFGQ